MDTSIIKENKRIFLESNPRAKGGKQIVTGSSLFRRFYAEGSPRRKISLFWTKELNKLLKKYSEKTQSRTTFLKDVDTLEKVMNDKFPEGFAHGRFYYFDALRSLSAAIKYRWCDEQSNKDYPLPTLCPITKQFLNFINSQYSKIPISRINRTLVLKIYKEFNELANKTTMAEWELVKFNEIGRITNEKIKCI